MATVLVRPAALVDLELALMTRDLWLWPIATAPVEHTGRRLAEQIRSRLINRRQGAWAIAESWTPVWIGFGDRWHQGDEPLPWSAHEALWTVLTEHRDQVRYTKRLGGIPRPSPSSTPPTGAADRRRKNPGFN